MDIETLKGLVCSEYHDKLDRILVMCNAPYARTAGLELVSITKDCVKMKKKILSEDLNSNGVVHGAVSYGLIDHTFAIADNIKSDGVGQSCNIIYHRPCKGPIIQTECCLINESRSLAIYDVRLFCEGKLIVSATCTAFRIRKD